MLGIPIIWTKEHFSVFDHSVAVTVSPDLKRHFVGLLFRLKMEVIIVFAQANEFLDEYVAARFVKKNLKDLVLADGNRDPRLHPTPP